MPPGPTRPSPLGEELNSGSYSALPTAILAAWRCLKRGGFIKQRVSKAAHVAPPQVRLVLGVGIDARGLGAHVLLVERHVGVAAHRGAPAEEEVGEEGDICKV